MQWNALHGVQLNRKQMEQRRQLAAKDLISGMKQSEVAEKYGISYAAVCQWMRKIRASGTDSLQMRKATGQPHRLTENQQRELVQILVAGALASGWHTDAWTGKRVVEVIHRRFGVKYHFKHMPRLLRSLGFRKIKPKKRAREKSEEAKREWLTSTWGQIKKT